MTETDTPNTTAEDFFTEAAESVKEAQEEHAEEAEIDEWSPESPSQLRGIFLKAVRFLPKPGAKFNTGPMYKAFIKDVDTGVTITVFCARKMLLRGLLDASPAKGSLIVFDYVGEKEGKSGYNYHEYYVRAAKSDPGYWAEITRPKPGELEQAAVQQQQAQQRASYGPDEAPF